MSLWARFWSWFDKTFFYGLNGFHELEGDDDGKTS